MLPLHRLAVSLVLLGLSVGRAGAETPDYRLGPQDQLQVRVYDLRTGTGEAHEWTAFEGEFTVGASGKISLPLVGELQASEITTSALAAAIAEKLQAKVGLATRPDASVEVKKYRPFYVLGSVDKPGEYEYRPNLTVLQAVSIAGGMSRVPGEALLGYAREALVSRGDLRSLAADRIDLLARQARLDAEIGNAEQLAFPAELTAMSTDADVARIMREERLMFSAHREGLRAQTQVLEQSKVLLQHEIESLQAKDQALARQLQINQKELDQISGLVSKGLVVVPRQLEMQRTTAQFEGERLDVQVAGLRAREGMSKADQDILELASRRRSDSLQEASEVRNKLAQTLQKIATSQALVTQSEITAPAAVAAETTQAMEPRFSVTRQAAGRSQTLSAQDGDRLQPGDVVRVEPNLPRAGLKTAATAGTTN